ncbi:MAG: V-type ATPase 116kDa subunit family protein [Lachnospiraceae bacterium]|nr:V-type ATPase 116kDa subunit family protein [Lachnospiraceae bacterium]
MIVKMKFLSITGPKTDIDRVVNQYLSKYEIHLENALAELKSVQNLTPYIQINPYRETLKLAEDYLQLLPADTVCEPKDMTLDEAVTFVNDLDHQMNQQTQRRADYESKRSKYHELYEKIEPFMGLDCDVSSIFKFKQIKYRFGKIPKEYYTKFENYIYDTMETVFYRCHSDDKYVWGIYFCLRDAVSKVDAVYASMHFERIFLPDEYEGTPDEAHAALADKLQEISAQLAVCDSDMQKYLMNHAGELKGAYKKLSDLSENFDVRKLAACTDSKKETFYILCGWMSEADAKAFQKEISNDPNLFCFIEDNDSNILTPPPTKLKNPRIFRPFEMFTRLYGLPGYDEMDPTMFIAITYALIFGAMFGDVGQGLCIVIGGALLYHYKHMALAAIMGSAGIFSVIFGFMYGSFFGFEDVIPAVWLKPREAMVNLPFIGNINTVFVVAISFGMFMILITMILHIISSIRAHDTEGIFFDQNAVCGFVFYGALVAVIFLYMTHHPVPATAVLIIMFGIPALIIMLKEPLTRIVKKRKPAIEGGKGMFFVQSFFELFEIMLSYFSNTLSFIRIGAFAMSHAAMMEVVLILAGAVEGGNPNWLVIVLGNVFVCGFEGLIVAIQVLRLEYYEMFSRFYKGNGREFVPFAKKTNK